MTSVSTSSPRTDGGPERHPVAAGCRCSSAAALPRPARTLYPPWRVGRPCPPVCNGQVSTRHATTCHIADGGMSVRSADRFRNSYRPDTMAGVPDWVKFKRSDTSAVIALVKAVAEANDPGEHGDGVEVVIEAPRKGWFGRLFDDGK